MYVNVLTNSLLTEENLLLLDTVVVKCKRGETTWFHIVVWNFKKINVGRRDPFSSFERQCITHEIGFVDLFTNQIFLKMSNTLKKSTF